jgi:hypothetical protein
MARTVPSIGETVDKILQEVDGSLIPKTASKKVLDTLPPLKKLANALRETPKPELNYAVLHVVKTAMLNGDVGPLPVPELKPQSGNSVSAGLRKTANALRLEDHYNHERILAKGAHALNAARGISLLRELVRE